MTKFISIHAKKYLDTISVLKEHDLWDLEHGMYECNNHVASTYSALHAPLVP